jgi:hypothetical protein
MEQHPHLSVRQEQVVAAGVRDQETEAVAVSARRTDDQRQAVDEALFIRAVHEELALARHRAEPLEEGLARRGLLHAEPFRERVECERLARFGELREQVLAARDRVRVARGFLAKARVLVLPAWLAGHGFAEIDMKQVPA